MTRVLVVDDEIDTLNLLRTILEISGYQAVTTLNSVEAIMLAEMEHPDCILLDIMMPQLDGFTLCKMMRLHPATMSLPIIFVTAYSALDIEERRLEAGADMVLPKPIGMDVLIEAVEKAAELRASRMPETRPMPEFLSAKKPSTTSPSVQTAQTPQPAIKADGKTAPLGSSQGTPKSATTPVQPAPVSAEPAKNDAKPVTAPAQPVVAAKAEPVADSSKPALKTVVKPLDDAPIDIGIAPDPVEETAKAAPAEAVPPAKETT
jgi:CheY-like chemotaxis protein